MITIFNRKEVYVTFSFDKALEMRARMMSGNVKSLLKRHSFERSDRRARQVFISKPLVEYRLYVHKKDVELAHFLMNQRGL